MTTTTTTAIPHGLSQKSRAVFGTVTHDYAFAAQELLQLESALRWHDRSELLAEQADAADAAHRPRLTKLAMDAASTSLRFWRALRFVDPLNPPRRPGRPTGDEWSGQRRQQARARRRRSDDADTSDS